MSRIRLSTTALFCLLTSSALAGGPPRLSLPIDGVTDGNSEECASLLNTALADRLFTYTDSDGISIEQHGEQWYVVLNLTEDVALSEVTAALADTSFSIPTENSVLFGQAILEFETPLANDSFEHDVRTLAQLQSAQIEELNRDGIEVDVTIITPEVLGLGEDLHEVLASDVVEDLLTNEGGHIEALPSYSAIRDAPMPFNESLQDIRWSAIWGCRSFGMISMPN